MGLDERPNSNLGAVEPTATALRGVNVQRPAESHPDVQPKVAAVTAASMDQNRPQRLHHPEQWKPTHAADDRSSSTSKLVAVETAATPLGGIDLQPPSEQWKQTQAEAVLDDLSQSCSGSAIAPETAAALADHEPQPGSHAEQWNRSAHSDAVFDERHGNYVAPETAAAVALGVDMYEPQPGSHPEQWHETPEETRARMLREQKDEALEQEAEEEEMKPTGWYIAAAGHKISEIAHEVAEAIGIEAPSQGETESDAARERGEASPPPDPMDLYPTDLPPEMRDEVHREHVDEAERLHHKGWLAAAGDKILEIAHEVAEAVGIEHPHPHGREARGDDSEGDAESAPHARPGKTYVPSDARPVEPPLHAEAYLKTPDDDASLRRSSNGSLNVSTDGAVAPPSTPVSS